MVIRAMILGSAACSNKYLCFDRSIYKLGHHPSPQFLNVPCIDMIACAR
ncbi:hypothetical protein NC651_038945 [Populus alba x Populus x berolinensis]|nr:hypothetical protein NC651_038945 [Populus alba x Populus x berolinensis]